MIGPIFKIAYLRLGHEEQNEHPENETPSPVPSKCPLRLERRQ